MYVYSTDQYTCVWKFVWKIRRISLPNSTNTFIMQTCFFHGLRFEALFDSALTGRIMAEIGETVADHF